MSNMPEAPTYRSGKKSVALLQVRRPKPRERELCNFWGDSPRSYLLEPWTCRVFPMS